MFVDLRFFIPFQSHFIWSDQPYLLLSDADWIHGFDNINGLFFYFTWVFLHAVNPEYNICYNHYLNMEYHIDNNPAID